MCEYLCYTLCAFTTHSQRAQAMPALYSRLPTGSILMYITETHSLDFWLRLQARLAAAFDDGSKRLAEFRVLAFPAGIDDANLMRSRANAARGEALTLLRDMEALRLLRMVVSDQVRSVSHDAGLLTKESQMACLRDIVDLYGNSVSGLPRRVPADEDLADFEKRYEALRNAGNGETSTADRARLRAQVVSLRVFGKEDGEPYEEEARNTETVLDRMATEVQQLKTGTLFALQVPAESLALLARFGVHVIEQHDEPAQSEAAPGDAQADAPAEPAGEAESAAAPAEQTA
jgi:hypothetical protein